jgi:hypothetical protein
MPGGGASVVGPGFMEADASDGSGSGGWVLALAKVDLDSTHVGNLRPIVTDKGLYNQEVLDPM